MPRRSTRRRKPTKHHMVDAQQPASKRVKSNHTYSTIKTKTKAEAKPKKPSSSALKKTDVNVEDQSGPFPKFAGPKMSELLGVKRLNINIYVCICRVAIIFVNHASTVYENIALHSLTASGQRWIFTRQRADLRWHESFNACSCSAVVSFLVLLPVTRRQMANAEW